MLKVQLSHDLASPLLGINGKSVCHPNACKLKSQSVRFWLDGEYSDSRWPSED